MQTDYVQRFLFEQLDIRGRLVCLTGAWKKMTDGRGYPPRVAELLGHSTALAAILGANQKDAGRITLQVQGNGPVKLLVADCAPGLRLRGMAKHEERSGDLLGEGKLAVTLEDGKSGQIYQSIVPLEGESLAAIIQEEAFEELDAPVRVVGALDTPVPYSPPLEEHFLPNAEKVGKAIRAIYDY